MLLCIVLRNNNDEKTERKDIVRRFITKDLDSLLTHMNNIADMFSMFNFFSRQVAVLALGCLATIKTLKRNIAEA